MRDIFGRERDTAHPFFSKEQIGRAAPFMPLVEVRIIP